MAIPQMLNSDAALTMVIAGGEDEGPVNGHQSLVQPFAPHLSRVLRLGTAKLVVSGGEENLDENQGLSVVAQAQSEDFQEFSPTNTQSFYDRVQLLKMCRAVQSLVLSDSEDEKDELLCQNLQRKHRRRPRSQREQERPIIRGLWVQELDWLKSSSREISTSYDIIPPPPQFTDSLSQDELQECGCISGSVCECSDTPDWMLPSKEPCPTLDTDDTSSSCNHSDSNSDLDSICTHETDSDFSCCAEECQHKPQSCGAMSNMTFDLMNVSGSQLGSEFSPTSQYKGRTLHTLHRPGDVSPDVSTLTATSDRVLDALRGKVTRMSRFFAAPFFKYLKAQTDWKIDRMSNEGFIFYHQLEPKGCQYREEEEYHILHHIQNGSYGDVFCVQDKTTGFTCAAKRIPLSRFSVEEVRTWSLLDSPRVVQLFGAVRDGLNIVLFMDLKPVCLGQILKELDRLSEDLALHYLHQSLGALEHLHQNGVLHLDVKVDNVLLSADCRDTFLCDFGLSEVLDEDQRSRQTFRGTVLPGTETHMAPEVARGDQLSAKADVWSSCCMLLHMLNGYQPWISYYSPPLCLHIVNEPAPLGEVPSNCNNFTAQVFRSGLQKNPDKRASAQELKRMTTKALRAVGGLSPLSVRALCQKFYQAKHQRDGPSHPAVLPCAPKVLSGAHRPGMLWVSPWRTTAVEEDILDFKVSDSDPMSESPSPGSEWDSRPKSLHDDYMLNWSSDSDLDIYMADAECLGKCVGMDQDYEGDLEEDEDEEDWESPESTDYLKNLKELFPLLQKGQQRIESPVGSEPELEYLRHDVDPSAKILTVSPEPRDDPPSCFSDTSPLDQDSDHSSDDLSSGVFSSCNSQSDTVSDDQQQWTGPMHQSSLYGSEGVDICVENIDGECLRIRERKLVKVGHVAIGLSGQRKWCKQDCMSTAPQHSHPTPKYETK
ncbi:uncharacterized protein LOC128762962 isoform X2 [Synchiropus splendidus]|uniref:uncharacterized protein LOC128762962 isoform X2 n=1 Tax=Synchiropus splendidus TaxID=270530 RepID=UPI00237E1271|nr:uncharacterized protein LOC128762962 isoform X2 [Synchiropus splendidus]